MLHAHKLIMIHRRFLSRSFSDPKFTYTRWASVASAKKILEEAEIASSDTQMPSIWSCQVFRPFQSSRLTLIWVQVHLVAAGITLCLDHLHHPDSQSSSENSKSLVDRTIHALNNDESVLCSRGVQLLTTLLAGGKHRLNASVSYQAHRPPSLGHSESSRTLDVTPGLDPSWVQRQVDEAFVCSQAGHDSAPVREGPAPNLDITAPSMGNMSFADQNQHMMYQQPSFAMDSAGIQGNSLTLDMSFFDIFSEYYPTLSGFDNPAVFEDLFH